MLLVIALVIAGRLTVEIRHHGEVDAFDVYEAALTAAIFLLSGPFVVVVVAATKAAAQIWLRTPWRKLAFNVAQWTACAGFGSLTFVALAPHASRPADQLPALVTAMVVVAVFNLSALIVLFAVLAGWSGAKGLLAPRDVIWSTGLTGVTVAAGVAVTAAAADHPAALLLIIALPPLLHWAGRGYAMLNFDLDRMRRLQAATHALSIVPDAREDAAEFLREVARCCSAQLAELTLLHRGDLRTQHVAVGHDREQHLPAGEDVSATALLFTSALPVRAVAHPPRPSRWAKTRRLSRRRWLWSRTDAPETRTRIPTSETALSAVRAAGRRDCLAVAIMIDDARSGVLAVYDRTGFADLDPADLMTLEALAREVAAAVRRAQLIESVLDARRNAARIVQGSNDGIVALNETGAVVTWNPAIEQLSGRPAEHMIGAPGLRDLDARDADEDPVQLETWAAGGALPGELHIRSSDGRRRWLSCSYAPTTRDGSNERLLVVMVRDITELRRQRELIAMQNRVLELVASDEPPEKSLRVIAALISRQINGVSAIVLPTGHITRRSAIITHDTRPGSPHIDRNALLDTLVALPAQHWLDAVGRRDPLVIDLPCPPTPFPGEEGGANTQAELRSCWVTPVLGGDQGNLRCILVVCPHAPSPLDNDIIELLESGARLAGVCVERDAARNRLAHQASHDPLTGLPNRTLFLDRCQRALHAALRKGEYVGALFIDLDRFKVVNDSLGHDAGDTLLIAVAERLRDAVRPYDTIARFGGDEFTVLCEGLPTPGEVAIVADRVLSLFSAPFHLQGREVFETASVGISLGRAPQGAEELMQHADAAMYSAKAGGGNRYEFFDARLARLAQTRLASYTGLRRAVDAGEFEVHYQPMVSLADGTPVGVEALARWRHPTRGLLAPDEFIDMAEETGLIVPLGTQVLRAALREMPDAPPAGGSRALGISVNLSVRQLTHPLLIPTVAQALNDAGVQPQRLTLEITESLAITDSAVMRAAITDLKQLGVGLCLDDFGTGHSSMDYLKLLPVDELKIERQFVSGVLTNKHDKAIVSAIIHLGHDLGLRVVAEGIETEGQATRLREVGCDVGQGYYFGRPMPAHQLLEVTGVSRA